MQTAAQKILTWEKLTNGKVRLISDFGVGNKQGNKLGNMLVVKLVTKLVTKLATKSETKS